MRYETLMDIGQFDFCYWLENIGPKNGRETSSTNILIIKGENRMLLQRLMISIFCITKSVSAQWCNVYKNHIMMHWQNATSFVCNLQMAQFSLSDTSNCDVWTDDCWWQASLKTISSWWWPGCCETHLDIICDNDNTIIMTSSLCRASGSPKFSGVKFQSINFLSCSA